MRLLKADASLGNVALFSWNWRFAEQELRRAIELNPNLPEAHLYYGQFLSAQGRIEDAVTEHKRALELDPTSQRSNQALCGMYWSAREYDKSKEQCLKVVQMYPHVSMPHDVLSSDYERKKNYPRALEELQRKLMLLGQADRSAAMGRAYAASGWQGVLKKADRVAEAYAVLGKTNEAFLWLDRAYDEHESLLLIKGMPDFDSIRSDARYADLLHRMGLQQ